MTTADVVQEVMRADQAPIMNNVHRSGYFEAIVGFALAEDGWTTPWDSWDFEHGSGFPDGGQAVGGGAGMGS